MRSVEGLDATPVIGNIEYAGVPAQERSRKSQIFFKQFFLVTSSMWMMLKCTP
jgi:hypothetical protein